MENKGFNLKKTIQIGVFRCAICDKMTSTEDHIIAKDLFPGFDYYICNKHRDKEIEGFRKENDRRLKKMENKNTCNKCLEEEDSTDLIWIDSEDFKPFKNDNWDSTKHQNATEILNYSALCEDCYKMECCL